jgi:hypothetical protein
MTFAARSLPPVRDGNCRGMAPCVPAELSPYERYVAETQRRFQILTDAGIEHDMAFECASWAAMAKVAKELNADDYEFSTQVYGE